VTTCCLCNSPDNPENAHWDPKGMGGRGKKAPASALVTKRLCAGFGGNTDPSTCHGAHHAGFIALDLTPHGVLRYCSTPALDASSNVARDAHKALKKRGLKLDGMWHPQAFADDFDPDTVDAIPDDDPAVDEPQEPDTDLGDSLSVLEARIGSESMTHGSGWRISAEALYTAEALLTAALGLKAGKAAAREWREQLTTADGVPIPISKSEASKMAAVVKYIPATLGRSLPSTRQYAASVAVKRGKRTAEESVTLAEALSLSAFRAEVYGEKEPAEPTLYECKSCGFQGTKDALIMEVS